jgi:hypothetical protein
LKSCEAGQPSDSTLKPETAIPVSAQQIRQQLARICAAEEFQRSKRSRRFLSYIVEETLAGRVGRIKAYSVALSVLDRDDTFGVQGGGGTRPPRQYGYATKPSHYGLADFRRRCGNGISGSLHHRSAVPICS